MTQTPADNRAPRLDARTLASLLLGAVVVTIDISLTSTAIPAIAQSLEISPASTILIINAYYLTVIAALLPLGALGEIVGHRRIYLAGLVVFGIGALASGMADSLTTLMATRGLQGIGAAAVSATTPALVKAAYPPDKIGRGLGLYAMVVGVGFTAGPTLVSAILSVAQWPWLFLGTVPLVVVTLLLARTGLPQTDRAQRPFDPIAAVLCALLFAALLTAVSSLGHLQPIPVVVGTVAALVLGVALKRREAGKTAPILAVDLFRIRLFALSSVTSITAFTVQALVFVVLPLFLTLQLGFTPVQAGLLITPWPAALALINGVSGRLSERITPGLLGAVGMTIVALGLLLLATMADDAQAWDIVWRLTVCGIGFGLFQSPNMVALMNSAPKDRSGSAGGILATSRLFGQSLGAATVAFCLSAFGNQGIGIALWVGVGAAVMSASVSAARLTRLGS